MTTAATSLLGLALPVTGELSGTWGDTVNTSLTSLLDTAVAGTTLLSSDADVTLTTTTLAANQARQAIILWTAGGTATRTITAPAQSKNYIVINKTSSTQSIKIVGVGPTTGVTIVAGTAALVAWNGLDFVTVSVMSTNGIVQVANGGTGAATLTGIAYGNGTGAFTAATAAQVVATISTTAVANATTAAACSGNSATATTAAACSGNSATATTAAACSGNSATATTAAACSGNSATATTATTAGSVTTTNWTVLESGGYLYFKYGAVNKMRLDSSGNLVVSGNVTGYGTI